MKMKESILVGAAGVPVDGNKPPRNTLTNEPVRGRKSDSPFGQVVRSATNRNPSSVKNLPIGLNSKELNSK